MGGLVGGIFDLVGGDPAAQEGKAYKDLYGFENPLGEKSITQGLDWNSDILSGDPAKIAEALAPEIKHGQEMVQQQAQQGAQFGNRSGGTNAATQAAQSQERGNIINLIGGLQKGAADTLTGAGENLLNMGSSNVGQSADLAYRNRQRQVGDVSGIASDVASIAMPFFGGAGAATPADIVGTLNPEFAATRGGVAPPDFSGEFLSGLENG